jgi:hypothetical protein
MTIEDIIADLRTRAANLRRYPFKSATMAEAARIAAAGFEEVAAQYQDTRHTPIG